MTVMVCYSTITLSKTYTLCFSFLFFLILAEYLPGEAAGYQGYVVEVSVGHKVSEHPQEVAHLRGVDVGLVEVGVDQMREPDDGVEQVTQ